MKPILFNTDMVRAIFDSRKTVTRRAVKPQPKGRIAYACMGYKHGTWGYPDKSAWKYWDDDSYKRPDGIAPEELERRWTPPCHTGDILYVRETWDNEPVTPGGHFRQRGVWYYKADGDLRPEGWRGNWHPSIHMPKEAARLFLRVTDVRVERLQDITADGCKHEGIWDDYKASSQKHHDALVELAYPKCFAELWNSTIKPADLNKYGWDSNPWVWVIEFDRIRKDTDCNT